MSKFALFLLIGCASISALPGQTTPTIQANGTASIAVNPDQATLTVGVVTDAATAQDAAQKNAVQTNAVLSALQQVLGTAGTVQTIGYSVNPRYNNANPSSIVGYTASNTLRVTINDLTTLPGRVIDTANQAGANSISGLSFGLQDSDPVMRQALSEAAKQALAHAGAIAAGLGGKVGAVVSAQEGGSVQPYAIFAAAPAQTPIQTGTVTVSATVSITVQMTS